MPKSSYRSLAMATGAWAAVAAAWSALAALTWRPHRLEPEPTVAGRQPHILVFPYRPHWARQSPPAWLGKPPRGAERRLPPVGFCPAGTDPEGHFPPRGLQVAHRRVDFPSQKGPGVATPRAPGPGRLNGTASIRGFGGSIPKQPRRLTTLDTAPEFPLGGALPDRPPLGIHTIAIAADLQANHPYPKRPPTAYGSASAGIIAGMEVARLLSAAARLRTDPQC